MFADPSGRKLFVQFNGKTEKYRNLDSETYNAALGRRFENKVRNIEEFSVIVKNHMQREQKEELEELKTLQKY